MKLPVIKLHKLLLAGAFAAICTANTAQAELPQISDARVVQPPPGANVAAAFFTISNPGTEPLFITDAQSNIAKQVEVHLSSVVDDIAKMEKQASVEVPAGESLDFKHGSYHIMFMGLNKDLKSGDNLDLVLNTSEGDIDISIPVISLEDAMSQGEMKSKMKGEMDSGMKGDPMHMDSNISKDSQ